MEDVHKKHLRKEIIEILKAADLSVLSSKKVREQVEAKLGTSLSSRKKEVDEIVMRFINNESDSEDSYSNDENNLLNKASDEKKFCNEMSTDEGLSLKSLAQTDKKLFKERKKAKKKNDVTLRKITGFTRPYTLSPELADIMGAKSLPRHEVVKKVWSIIKERNLYDPKNKQYAFCDDELIKVMKVKRFRTFGMLKYLKPHFIE